jgi:hypothetical protein
LTPDLINGLFEFAGSLFIWRSILLLHRQRMVRGVSLLTTGFFAAWGVWNLYYYPNLDQWLSFAGGLSIVTANLIWVGQILYYLRREANHAGS